MPILLPRHHLKGWDYRLAKQHPLENQSCEECVLHKRIRMCALGSSRAPCASSAPRSSGSPSVSGTPIRTTTRELIIPTVHEKQLTHPSCPLCRPWTIRTAQPAQLLILATGKLDNIVNRLYSDSGRKNLGTDAFRDVSELGVIGVFSFILF